MLRMLKAWSKWGTGLLLILAACAPRPTIRLAENPWLGASLDAQVAKIILAEKMGYPVELVPITEEAQWQALADGQLSASLEVWPSGQVQQFKRYVDQEKSVENIGLLGVVGKINWYIPAYLLTDHPDLANWQGFKDPANAALFRTPASGDKGQFLAGDPSWMQYDRDIIHNLGLPLQVVEAGSEQAILEAVDEAYRLRKPILFYFWTPHYIQVKYDLAAVRLPDYNRACYEKAAAGGVNCDYPPEVLSKIAWAGLKNQAPDAYQLLSNLSYSNQDQVEMIAMVALEGKTPEEAARAWVEAHPDQWQYWLPVR